ncbi:MAG: hypothetical protein JRJ85_24925 [Deltaproteobacteria bacterium]|nr:hypothetical protein [Deltaproteobacteria bacterium]
MNEYSGVKGAEQMSSVSDRIWRIQKKRKLNDRKRREGRGDQKEKPERARDTFLENEPTDDAMDDTLDSPVGYGGSKMKKRLRKKIDLVI